MKINPRKAFTSTTLALVVAASMVACGTNSDSGSEPANTGYTAPDCDFDDLLEGNDPDCAGQRGRDAERRLSKRQKQILNDARRRSAKPTSKGVAPKGGSPLRQPTSNRVAPTAKAPRNPITIPAPRKAATAPGAPKLAPKPFSTKRR